MIQMRPIIRNALLEIEGLDNVTQTYPKDWNNLPVLVYGCQQRVAIQDHEGNETHTSWTIDLQYFTDTNPYPIATDIHTRLLQLGFRGRIVDGNTADYNRVHGRYRAIVDNLTGRVSQ